MALLFQELFLENQGSKTNFIKASKADKLLNETSFELIFNISQADILEFSQEMHFPEHKKILLN